MRLHNASTISNDNAMKYMRLRLVHTLSLILVVTVLLAVLAMGAVTAWNLKSGFTDYLAARDVERLEQFAALTSEIILHHPAHQADRVGRVVQTDSALA
jgi:hypothetical protein